MDLKIACFHPTLSRVVESKQSKGNTMKNVKRAYQVLEIACAMAERLPGYSVRSRIEEIQLHTDGYAEPGYDGQHVATGNWNVVDEYVPAADGAQWGTRQQVQGGDLPERLAKIFEKLGFEIEWSDEWQTCDDCNKLVRHQPDSYGWKPSYAQVNDCEILCHECLTEDPEGYLESLEDREEAANTLDIDPADHGYVKTEECESGWHHGQTDDPRKVAKTLREKGISRFLFALDEPSQFYTRWSVWVHEDEIALLRQSA